MRKAAPFWLTILVAAVALVASALLYVDYVRPLPVFCAADGGCGMVKKTIFAYPLGVAWLPMPIFGIAGFFAIALLALLPGRRARIAQASLAVGGAIVASGLLIVQALMGTICPYCAAADVSALVVAGLSVARALKGWDPPEHKAHVGAAALGTVLAIGAPLAFGFTKKPLEGALPTVISEEIAKAPRGKVTIVDFVDFECPFCRMTHAELSPLLVAYKDKVHVVRKNVPLRMHPHAMDAARAACCGEEQGKGEEMAEALFKSEDISGEGCAKLAGDLGLDVARFRACTTSPATEARIKAEAESFRAAKGHGLPTIFVGTQRLEGAQDRESLKAALEEALRAL
jgi:protein-disulfide isomerase